MRLGQMARQLGKSTKEVHSYVEKGLGVEMSSHPNAKIADDLLEKIKGHFKVEEKTETVAEPKKKVKKDEKVDSIKEAIDLKDHELPTEPEKVEYEVPNIEGPKVVGKIDLPESELNRAKPEPRKEPRKPRKIRRKPKEESRKKRVGKKIETQEEKRQREIKEMQARRKKEAEKRKEAAKKRYLEQTQEKQVAKVSKKKKRKKQEPTSSVANTTTENAIKEQKPKSLLGKIWAWLNDQN